MISPLKDIVVATVLGIGAGMVWNNFKDGELDRISRFYKCSSLLFIGGHTTVTCVSLAYMDKDVGKGFRSLQQLDVCCL
ncbi:hypothetical protein PC129_g233 [Phytophthora cactorum]|uniref:Uncharacterized protein n=1 Tax=Phytophthora cactorum TaxID=29920 RepID=A0A8T1IW38_9STRA|nr:hypothetical protein PC129_g233 [Phytophthora cactorum]